MNEKRLTNRLITNWNMIKGESTMPPYQKLNPAALDDVWTNCATCTLQPGGEKDHVFVFDRVGQDINKLFGEDLVGKPVSASKKHVKAASMIKKVEAVFSSPEPVQDEGQFVSDKNKIVKYRSCILPFGSAGDQITHILIGLSWREF